MPIKYYGDVKKYFKLLVKTLVNTLIHCCSIELIYVYVMPEARYTFCDLSFFKTQFVDRLLSVCQTSCYSCIILTPRSDYYSVIRVTGEYVPVFFLQSQSICRVGEIYRAERLFQRVATGGLSSVTSKFINSYIHWVRSQSHYSQEGVTTWEKYVEDVRPAIISWLGFSWYVSWTSSVVTSMFRRIVVIFWFY